MFLQVGDKGGHGFDRKAEVRIFVMFGSCRGTADHVQVTLADAEPGMAAVVKGLGDGIEANHLLVKPGAGLQVCHIEGDVVEVGFGLGLALRRVSK